MRRLLLAFTLSLSTIPLAAQTATPPMGWNSWDAYGLTITEPQFRANVAVLRDQLKSFGYTYAVIDEGWFFFNPEARPHPDQLIYAIDPFGRYVPVVQRFPSAVMPMFITTHNPAATQLHATLTSSSFEPLADWVHAQGLKFGIHIVRGIPRASVERNLPIANSSFHAQDAADTTDACPWDPTNWGVNDNAAGQAWYDSLLAQYAAWGVDLLKVDCIADHPYKADEIRMIRHALDKATAKTHHPMVLSLSPGPTNPAHAREVSHLATMWRISNDVWDVWNSSKADFPQSIKGQFDRAADWMPLDLPSGTFVDLDMLPLGELRPSPGWGDARHTRLTPDEQKTLLTLWALNRSPLILGANLTLLDPATLALLTNRDLLAFDRDSQITAIDGTPILDGRAPALGEDPLVLMAGWIRRDQKTNDIETYYAFFNRGDTPLPVNRSLNELDGAPAAAPPRHDALFDVWAQRSIGRVSRVKLTIPPHGVVLLETR